MHIPKNATTITIDPLDELEILVISNKKDLKKLIKKNTWQENYILDYLNDNGGSYVIYDKNGVPYHVLYFNVKITRVIVHECVHKIHQIFDLKGIPLSLDNSEICAYFTDYLVDKVRMILGNNI